MGVRLTAGLGALGLAAFAAGMAATAQGPSSDAPARSLAKTEAVEYLYPEQVTLPAGKPTGVALHFRIAPGLHINSHAPQDEFLIPTALQIPPGSGVKLEDARYPAGVDFALPSDPGTKLNVYTGEFVIQARLNAEPGDHLVEAKLRYQACDQRQCMPPRTITVPVDVVGK